MYRKINAIFWDFDGTLVDTRMKNLQVTRQILGQISESKTDQIPLLQSIENYDRALRHTVNWRTFYSEKLNMNESQIDRAGQMWTEYQLKDKTPTPLFDGIHSVIKTLKDIPQGIISQNSRLSICTVLEAAGINQYFDIIVGYEEVGLKLQKPNPKGMLLGLEKINLHPDGIILFIGDHETDVLFVNNSNKMLQKQNSACKVISVGAFYGYDKEPEIWKYHPDYSAHEVNELISITEEINRI